MLKMTKKDLFVLGIVLLIILALVVGARDKAKQVPRDDKHRTFFEAVEKGLNRAEVERGCIECHNLQSLRLPKKHPPKEQCLICHKVGYRRD